MVPQNLVYDRRGRAQWSTKYFPHQNGLSYKAHNIALAFAEVKMIMGTKERKTSLRIEKFSSALTPKPILSEKK